MSLNVSGLTWYDIKYEMIHKGHRIFPMSFFATLNQVKPMIQCDNHKCKYNQRGHCVNMHLTVERERCVCFELRRSRRQKYTHETDLNHEPVKYTNRNRILK
jgi:hypothetical protein